MNRKSKKEKDDEKENSPTKVKKVDNAKQSTDTTGSSTTKKKSSTSSTNHETSANQAASTAQQIAAAEAASSPSKEKRSMSSPPQSPKKEDIIAAKPPMSPVNGIHDETSLNKQLTVDTNMNSTPQRHYLEAQNTNLLQPSPLSTKSTASTVNTQSNINYPHTHHQQRVFSASDAAQSASFVRGNFMSSTISGSDLHRFLNSGYINSADQYLQRGVELKTPKSPHFHRPPNFSYSKMGPNYVTPQQQRSSARG